MSTIVSNLLTGIASSALFYGLMRVIKAIVNAIRKQPPMNTDIDKSGNPPITYYTYKTINIDKLVIADKEIAKQIVEALFGNEHSIAEQTAPILTPHS